AGHDVGATLGERHPGPCLPLSDGARNPHRLGGDAFDACSEALVGAEPGVEEKTVTSPPGRVTLDRDERIPRLERRTHGRDEVPAPPESDAPHVLELRSRKAPRLMVLPNEHGESAGNIARFVPLEPAEERVAPARRKILHGQ